MKRIHSFGRAESPLLEKGEGGILEGTEKILRIKKTQRTLHAASPLLFQGEGLGERSDKQN